MSNIIQDGTGTRTAAKVDKNNRLRTLSNTVSVEVGATYNGDVFDISTGTILLTSDSESGILYIENDGNDDLIFTSQLAIVGASTGGTGVAVFTTYTDVTGGSLVTAETDADLANRRLNDPTNFKGIAYKGAEGSTITGRVIQQTPIVDQLSSNTSAFIPAGQTVAASITPPTGNTSMVVGYVISLAQNASEYVNG